MLLVGRTVGLGLVGGREEQSMKGGAGVCSAHRAHLPAGKLVNNLPLL